MKSGTAAFDRVLVFVFGVLLIAAGLIPTALYFDIPYVSDVVESYDRNQLGTLPAQPWFPFALVGGFIVSLILGIWIVAANLASRSFSTEKRRPGPAGSRRYRAQRAAHCPGGV